MRNNLQIFLHLETEGWVWVGLTQNMENLVGVLTFLMIYDL